MFFFFIFFKAVWHGSGEERLSSRFPFKWLPDSIWGHLHLRNVLDCQPEAPRGSRPHFTTPTLEPSGSRTSFFFTPLLPRGVCLKWPDTLHLAEEPEDLSLNSKMFFSRQVKDPIFSQEGGGGAGTSVGTLRPSFLLVLFQTGWKIRFSPRVV